MIVKVGVIGIGTVSQLMHLPIYREKVQRNTLYRLL